MSLLRSYNPHSSLNPFLAQSVRDTAALTRSFHKDLLFRGETGHMVLLIQPTPTFSAPLSPEPAFLFFLAKPTPVSLPNEVEHVNQTEKNWQGLS